MLRKTNALICWDVEGLGELLDPVVGFGLGLGVVPIEDDDHSLGFFHYSWPNSIIFDVACLVRRVPPTSQNSMEMSRLSTSVSCSTILTELVGAIGGIEHIGLLGEVVHDCRLARGFRSDDQEFEFC